MKVEVIKVFFDNNGLHRVGDIVDVENLDLNLMKPLKTEEKTDKPVKKSK